MAQTMHAKDTISGSLAECYITIEGRRINCMQAKNVEAKFERTKVEIPILGQTGKGNKSTGWKGTGTASFYMNNSVFRELMLQYKDTGKDVYFEMQITNEDPTASVGRQTVVLIDCNLDSGILAKFDIEEDVISEDMDFTFEDFKIPETFTMLDGME